MGLKLFKAEFILSLLKESFLGDGYVLNLGFW